ncbi:hypothetical protein RHGRI_029470 [Rhododendron griersonianum]|uniref:DUF4283 domain-containing protein n=1 Tax=Rhododendron griersonianum TaxID=479676 RepID=A0AAV6IJK5_9ERIC|nr:hypothetical protein RHGRI_029470 [Rhododendron griersonianum]
MDKIHRLWNLEGSKVPIDVGLGFYIIRFNTKIDYLRAYMGGPWIIQDHYLTVRKWHSIFKAEMAEAIRTVVRVRIPLLPMEYYDDETIKVVAKKLESPLKVDEYTTVETARESFARTCVEKDLSQPLPPSVAGRPSEGAVHPSTEKTPGGTEITDEGQVHSDKIIMYNGHMAENDKEIGYGEWMLVSRKNPYVKRPNGPGNRFSYQATKANKAQDNTRSGSQETTHKGQMPRKEGPANNAHGAKQIEKNDAPYTSKNSNTQSGSRFAPLEGQDLPP